MRDHYKKSIKEGSTGQPAKKKRAIYWERLQFLNTVENERTTFSNVLSLMENKEDNPEQSSNQIPEQESQETLTVTTAPSPDSQRSVCRTPSSKSRRERFAIQKYLEQRNEERAHFQRCIEDLVKQPENENDIDLFFKTMAATVKKFKPDLATKTKASVFKIVTEMEILNQNTDLQNNKNLANSSSSSQWTLHSSVTDHSYVTYDIN